MPVKFMTSYREDSTAVFGYYKKLAERAMEQVADPELFAVLDEEMNSIAIIVKHMAGNMRSRWTDFLTSDGEKPDRNRDSEFEQPPATREAVMKMWEEGWGHLFAALEPLSRCGYEPHGYDPGRGTLGDAGDQPSDRPLCLSLRPDCAAGKTFQGTRMEVAERASQ